MTSRTGPLSDEAILAHCQRYRPIPLGAAQHILMKDLKPQHEHAFGNKPLKYHTQMARPKDFDTLAKAITKMSGNPMVRDELNSVYAKDLQSVPEAKPVLHNNLPPNRGAVVPRLVSTPFFFGTPDPTPTVHFFGTPDPTPSVDVHPRGPGLTPPTNSPNPKSPALRYALSQQLRSALSNVIPDLQDDINRVASDWSTPSEVDSDGYFTEDKNNDTAAHLGYNLPPFAFRDPLSYQSRHAGGRAHSAGMPGSSTDPL